MWQNRVPDFTESSINFHPTEKILNLLDEGLTSDSAITGNMTVMAFSVGVGALALYELAGDGLDKFRQLSASVINRLRNEE